MPTESTAKIRITDLRERINVIDAQILERLKERLSAARKIGQLKAASDASVLDTGREVEVLTRLLAENLSGELGNFDLLKIYRPIISAARDLQHQGKRHADPPSLYAVFGNPIGHSLSPLMHTAAFWATGYNGTCFAVEATESQQIVNGMKTIGIRGASVTIPHKTAVLPLLDEIDDQAGKIGAVNTVLNQSGVTKGFNTDCDGVVSALTAVADLAGKSVLLVGAGGAARAAAFGIQSAGGRVTICNRTADKGERLALELDCEFEPLDKLPLLESEILINATPVGMAPGPDASVVPENALRNGMLVMDLVYTPLRTRLLREAAAAGCETIDGCEMFIHQGARQFEIWTGLAAPVEIMRLFVHAALAKNG